MLKSMNTNPKVFSGRFWLAIITGLCMLILTCMISAVLYNHPTTEASGAVMLIIGFLCGNLTTVIVNYFQKKPNQQ